MRERKRNVELDKRADSLKLKPTKMQTNNFNNVPIAPRKSDIDIIRGERMALCSMLKYKNRVRQGG
jgi:hypothetical protein